MNRNRDKFEGVAIFVKVVEAKNFTQAAAELGNSTSYLSREVNKLEERLGIKLLNRTTRTLSLTDEGRIYYLRCKQIVNDIEDTELAIAHLHDMPRGVLKINSPVSFGIQFLRKLLPGFLDAYPDIQLEVDFNDRTIDIVSEGYDAIICLGELKDSTRIARQIMETRSIIVASPDYLKRHSSPKKPQDLIDHSCISYSIERLSSYWDFFDETGNQTGVNIIPRVVCNSAELELSLALSGIGIARLPYYFCSKEIEAGQLISIMKSYSQREIAVNVIYPHRQYVSAKVKVFVDYLQTCFAEYKE